MFDVHEIIKWCGGEVLRRGRSEFVEGISTDTRKKTAGMLFLALKGERFDGHDFIDEAVRKGARGILTEKEVNPEGVWVIKTEDNLKALGDIAMGYRIKKGFRILALTGTSGKTTTKEFIHHLISPFLKWGKNEGNMNNLIGVPLTLLSLRDEEGAVLELATNRPGEIKRLCEICRPDFGLITMIGEAHTEGLGDIHGVMEEKSWLFKSIPEDGIGFVNMDDPLVVKASGFLLSRKVCYSMKREEADFYGKLLSMDENGMGGEVEGKGVRISFSTNLRGRHLFQNILSAIAVAVTLGIAPHLLRERIGTLSLPPGRGEIVEMGGFTILDDSYNANPVSFKAALEMLSLFRGRRKVLVIGDMLELGKNAPKAHFQLGEWIASLSPFAVFIKGDFREEVKKGVGKKTELVIEFENPSECVNRLLELLKEGDVILFKGSHRTGIHEVVRIFKERIGGKNVS